MAAKGSGVQARLDKIKGFLGSKRRPQTIPWDPDSTDFPTRKELPELPNAPKGAAWFWGKDDYVLSSESRPAIEAYIFQLGRINLLTPARVKLASSEIRLGEMVPLKFAYTYKSP